MKDKTLSPLKSIRAKCLDCSCGSSYEVEHCTIERCPLYPYRLGKNPNIKYELTPARKAALEKASLARNTPTHAADLAKT